MPFARMMRMKAMNVQTIQVFNEIPEYSLKSSKLPYKVFKGIEAYWKDIILLYEHHTDIF